MEYFIKQSIIKKLNEDASFRMKLAIELQITERGVYNIVKRYINNATANSTLTKLAAIEFFRSEGFDDKEIFFTKSPA